MEELTIEGLNDFISGYKQRLSEEMFPNSMCSTTKKFKKDGLIVKVILENPRYIISEERRKGNKAEKEVEVNNERLEKANEKINEIYSEFPEWNPQKTFL